MPLWRARSADGLYNEKRDCDLVLPTDVPAIAETLSPDEVDHSVIERLATSASSLHGAAEPNAWTQVEGFAQEAREERDQEVTINGSTQSSTLPNESARGRNGSKPISSAPTKERI